MNRPCAIVLLLLFLGGQTVEAQNPVCEICGCSFCPPGFTMGNPDANTPIPPEFQDQAPSGFTEIPCSLLDLAGTSGQISPENCNDELRLQPDLRANCGCPALPATVSTDLISNEVDFSDGFDCQGTGIQLNGNRPFPTLVNNGVNDKCTLQLTSDKAEPRAVSAFTALEFDDGNFWFDTRFRYRMFGPNAGNGDGITFVVHQDERAQSARGGSGGKLGVYGSSIIKPALVVEFDTFKNKFGLVPSDKETNAIHVTFIDSNGDVFEVIEEEFEPLKTSSNGATDMEVLITLVNDELTVSVDNTPVVNVCMKLTDGGGRGPGFTGSFLTAGFTSSTGTQGDQQELLLWQFQELTPPPGFVSSATCNVQVKETLAPTLPPVPAPTNSPVKQPTPAPISTAAPAPARQARVLVTVAATEELNDTFITAFEEACSFFLSRELGLPDTTCDIESQQVNDDSTVILTVLVEAIAPGLDVEEFGDLVLAALNDPVFADPLNVVGSGLGQPVLTTVVTLTIDNVQNGQLTPGGIAVLEATCREFLTVRVGNPNFRCQVIPLTGLPMNDVDGRRKLQGGASPVIIDQIVNAGAPSDFTQPSTPSEFDTAVNDAYSTDGDDFVADVVDRAGNTGVTDFTGTTDVEVMPNDPLTRFLRNLLPLLMLIIRAFAS